MWIRSESNNKFRERAAVSPLKFRPNISINPAKNSAELIKFQNGINNFIRFWIYLSSYIMEVTPLALTIKTRPYFNCKFWFFIFHIVISTSLSKNYAEYRGCRSEAPADGTAKFCWINRWCKYTMGQLKLSFLLDFLRKNFLN